MNTNFNSNANVNASVVIPKRPAAAERRHDTRHSFTAEAEIVEEVSGTRLYMDARVGDLSMSGCYLDTINPFAPGSRAHLRIHFRHELFTCLATVKNVQPAMGMGLAFDPLNQVQSELLQSWLNESAAVAAALFDDEDPWEHGNPAADPSPANSTGESSPNSKSSPTPPHESSPQSSDDLFSLRLAKLLHHKGLLDEDEMDQLLSGSIL